MSKKIIIGTRGSKLALTQTNMVKTMLEKVHEGLEVEVKIIVTSGDRNQKVPMVGDGRSLKIDFVKEIERALLDREIHLAVHSMKDMPLKSVEGLIVGATPVRADYRDALLVKEGDNTLMNLQAGAVIGTSSLRRGKSILSLRPDLIVKPIRGNVETRMKKMAMGQFDAIVLAAAGLKRLGLENVIDHYMDVEDMMPAPAQGILGLQCHVDDQETRALLGAINDEQVAIVAKAERKFGKIFDGGCHTPMGCLGTIDGDRLTLKGMYIHEEKMYKSQVKGLVNQPEELAEKLADDIWRQING